MPETPDRIPQITIVDLLDIMRKLRDPETGCPWDVEQSFQTIAPYTVEEAYEVADAIEREDYQDLCSELGDLLFQVVFHAQMALEEDLFSFADVVQSICDKLTRRHPHVFAGHQIEPDQLSKQWEAFKRAERSEKNHSTGLLDDIPASMPSLTRAQKLQKRASQHGFDWHDIEPVFEKIQEEINEVKAELNPPIDTHRIEMEVGDLLFSCVNLARHLNVDPEWSLRQANQRFQDRFSYIETQLCAQNRSITDAELEELDQLWNEAKSAMTESPRIR